MKIGELFVNLGVKGSEKTVGALVGVGKGMGDLKSMSLETKAAIAGVFYGLEKLMAHSVALGTSLTQNSALLDVSAKTLQKWQYAGVQAGDTAEGVVSSIKGINSAMAELYTGGTAAEYMGLVGERLLGKGGFSISRAMKDPLYVMERLQTLAQDKSIPTGVLTNMLRSFGVGEGTNVALRKGAFNDANFAKAPVLSDATVSRLQKVQAAMANFEQHVSNIFAHLAATHGQKFIGELDNIAVSLGHVIGNLDTIAQKIGLFKTLAEALEGIANTMELVSNPDKFMKNADGSTGLPGWKDSKLGKWFNSFFDTDSSQGTAAMKGFAGVPSPSIPLPWGGKDVTIHQNITHHGDAKDTHAVGRTHKQAVSNAAKQSFAQTQAN